jgi:MvaI/BcnI restriction endonuclease family
MRQLTEIEINRLKLLTENSVEATLIEPTETGLIKSIMDATGPVRNYFKSKSIHNFEIQKQGQENKIQVPAELVFPGKTITSLASLYRPITKKGDPRIWFKGLGNYAKPNDILGIIWFNGMLYVVNITQVDIEKLLSAAVANPLQELVKAVKQTSNAIAEELLFKLRKIAEKGFVPALLNADTAIGRTLEFLLDIPINSSKKPDYKGIELKSFRDKRSNRKNLFTKVPDWDISKFNKSDDILNHFGYRRDGVFRLYCTVSCLVRNSRGLILKVDNHANNLIENSDKKEIGDFAAWRLEKLQQSLLTKHNETFWVAADSKIIDGKEYFHFKKAEHTKKPIVSQFGILLEQGIITLDHLIKKNPKGGVTEKGPSFKLKPNALDLLFPPSNVYSLLDK